MNATLRISSSDVRKELSIQDDRTESDNRVEVTLLKGIAENNLPHTVRCKSTKPPYAERHVRWCGRSVNVKVGGKCLLWITFTSYPIYSEHYFCTFVILLTRLLGCLPKAQFISSSGKVLWILPPITNPQFCRTFCRAFSLLSATTSNTPSKMYCVRTL